MDQPILTVKNLKITRNKMAVLSIDDFSIGNGELMAVIGPNGAGKSTFILALCGLLPYDQGELTFENKVIKLDDMFDYRRKIALVLQNPLLLDESVEKNIMLGLRFRGVPVKEARQKAYHWLERLDIVHLAKRKAKQLSGGEGQRVSLARALVLKPKLLFLDEPFGALDAPTRTRLIDDFIRLQKEESITTFFVTHDQNEALWLGDRVTLIMDGGVRQVGKPEEIFNTPVDVEVADFVGTETIIPGKVIENREGLAVVKVDGYNLEVVGDNHPGESVYVCVRPENVTLWNSEAPEISSIKNSIKGTIMQIAPQGILDRVVLDCGFPIVALITRNSTWEMGFEAGMEVTATFKSSTAHLVIRNQP